MADNLPHEDDDKGGKLRRKREAQARALMVLVAFVAFIFLVSIVKVNHHSKYMPSSVRKARRTQREEVEDKSIDLQSAGRQMVESFLPPDSIYNLSVKDMQGSSVSLEQYSGLVTLIVNVACK